MTEKDVMDKMFDLAFEMKNEQSKMPFFTTISEGERGILGLLGKSYPDPLSSGDLAEKMFIGTGRVGNALKSLEKKGLIYRKKDEKDKRKVWVHLTDLGYQDFQKIDKACMHFLENLIELVSIEKFDAFLDQFQEILKAGEEIKKRKEYQNLW